MRIDNIEYVYIVRFHEAPDGHTERSYYFFSLAAIFDRFTPEEVGFSVWSLHRAKVREGNKYEGRRCIVYRVPVHRKPRRARKKA
nr:MAG TPA: hypothetical protein [Caudoviricetes sp.]